MAQLGKLPPLYRFILNPYDDVRFSTCPGCGQRTLLRKVPLVVHVDPLNPVLLNKRCRYCPPCDLLIAHQDELEHSLVLTFREGTPEVIGNDYLVLGTVDKATWRKQQKEPIPMARMLAYVHRFKDNLTLSHTPAGWYSEDQPPTPRTAPPPTRPTGWQSEDSSTSKEAPAWPASTIDDRRQVETLLEVMKAHLPIKAEVQRSVAKYFRTQGWFIPPHRQVIIQDVLYTGDEGGIMCALSSPESKKAVVISLTHLKIPYRHPLEKEIRAYQKERRKKL
ncbi:MAG: hypothetical protein MUO62_07750 [Anaerolineales bacterium]|nr:hypothetical protein [Anaerolineales bacterium]